MLSMCKWDIFISYARTDFQSAKALYDLLNLLNPSVQVFLDEQCISPGAPWNEKIATAQKSALITVVLISSNTENAYYQTEEIIHAISLARNESRGHRVVPVYLDQGIISSDRIPLGLRQLQWLTLTSDFGLDVIAKKLISLRDQLLASLTTKEENLQSENSSLGRSRSIKKVLRTTEYNYVLIRNTPGFNASLLEELKNRADKLMLGKFPYEEDPYKGSRTNETDYKNECRNFLKSDARVLLTIHPENARWSPEEIKGFVLELIDKKKKVIFFESGQEIENAQSKMLPELPDSRNTPAVYVMRTNYRHAMLVILDEVCKISRYRKKNNLVIVTLLPAQGLSPAADERRKVLDQIIMGIMCKSSSDGVLNINGITGRYLNDTTEDDNTTAFVHALHDLKHGHDIAIVSSNTKDWDPDEAKRKANVLRKIAEYAEENEAFLLAFCGNDDLAYAYYEISPNSFSTNVSFR